MLLGRTMSPMVHSDLRDLIFDKYRETVFPLLITASSALAFGPSATITPIILTLTLLLFYSRFLFRSASPFGVPQGVLLCALAVGASVSRCQAALTALSAPSESILALFGFALILSFFTLLTLYLDTKLCTRFKSSWTQITLFPALWATLWWIFSYSPVGRLSTWSASDHSDAYNWIVPIAGPVSKDWIIGAWAVVMSQFIGAWYMGPPDEDLLLDNQPRRQQFGGLRFQVGILALCLSFATTPSFLIPQFPLPVSNINVSTPLTVGCVLPSFQRYKHHVLTLDDYIEESKKIQSLARVILWPEGAVVFNNASERDEGLQSVREKITGSHTGVSFEETIDDPRDLTGKTSMRLTGIAMVSKDSEPHIYYKRHLVPVAESFSLGPSSTPPSIFEIELVHPSDVKKTAWAPGPSYTRSIPMTSSICLDFAFPSQFANLSSRPALILAPARTWERTVGHAMWLQAQQRAAELQSIVLWCDGGEGGVSGVAGRGFNDVVQVGSGSFVRTIGIQYPFDNQKTYFARFGDIFLILIWIFTLVPGQINFEFSAFTTLWTWVNKHRPRAGQYLRKIRAGQNST